MLHRAEILRRLYAQIKVNGHILGAVAGSGMTAKFAVMGGADFLLALSAGRFRIMGRSSFASYLCYADSNSIAMALGRDELLPLIHDTPVLFGLLASDPKINLYDYLQEISACGFSGITNYPTMCLIDGNFGKALAEEGNLYAKEVEAIRLAHFLDLFTVAFVADAQQAREMTEAGADVICAHLGLTKGGFLGAKKYLSINAARKLADEVFIAVDQVRSDVIKMVYAGPANTPMDMLYMYQNTACQGYIGGSTFERIPTERAILNTTRAFKSRGSLQEDDPMLKLYNGGLNAEGYSEFVKRHIEEHYMDKIQLRDLAEVAHVSESYLSVRFKRDVGCSFTEYLMRFRLNKAKEFLKRKTLTCKEVGNMVGYADYAQFSKVFRKYVGVSPTQFRRQG